MQREHGQRGPAKFYRPGVHIFRARCRGPCGQIHRGQTGRQEQAVVQQVIERRAKGQKPLAETERDHDQGQQPGDLTAG